MNDDATEKWATWTLESHRNADSRWTRLQTAYQPGASRLGEKKWLQLVKQRLVRLEQMDLLGARESERLKILRFDQLSPGDKQRLKQADVRPTHVAALGLAEAQPGSGSKPVERFLSFRPGSRLREGRLSLQVIIDTHAEQSIGMNIQLRGLDWKDRRFYLRYDLDFVQMGSSPVAHFMAHWHIGDDPDEGDAETYHPRLPTLILEPQDVLDTLVETFYPSGPKDVDQ